MVDMEWLEMASRAKLKLAVRLAEGMLAETTDTISSALATDPGMGAYHFLRAGAQLAVGEQKKLLTRLRSGDVEEKAHKPDDYMVRDSTGKVMAVATGLGSSDEAIEAAKAWIGKGGGA